MFFSKKLENKNKIKHCFFSRKNGVSKGIYESLNCGPGSNDSEKNIVKNLNFVANFMETKFEDMILMNQTHSNKVIFISEKNKNQKKFNSDAVITSLRNLALCVLTADCVPVLLYDENNDLIGCLHAGWKGAISGIIENTINEFKKQNSNCKIIASIGPCIGVNNYEVDVNFYKRFLLDSKVNRKFFFKSNDNKFNFDLRNYISEKLKKCKVHEFDNILKDTFSDSNNFFSFRRSTKQGEKDYGRCISSIVLKD